MTFDLTPAELQAVFDALNAQRNALTAVGNKLQEQYRAQTTPPVPDDDQRPSA